jgi:RNA polymerase sigma-70 factor, ECF subfamily
MSLEQGIRTSWQRFLETFEPHRPELYRYCRYLTRSPWEAEDLVQDAFARAFATLGTMFSPLESPRAWLFRVASNLWIDRMRRAQRTLPAPAAPAPAVEPRELREAAGTLLAQLAPQERAAIVLADVFGMTVPEIALAVSTTEAAIRAALHRGRGKLADPDDDEPRLPVPAALDAFVTAFNARDLQALTALLLDRSVIEIDGVVTEYGRDQPADPETGSWFHSMRALPASDAAIGPHLADYVPSEPRCELRVHRGHPILVFWYEHTTGPAVRAVATIETDAEHVLHMKSYFFTPEVIAEVCSELGLPFRTNGYRYW